MIQNKLYPHALKVIYDAIPIVFDDVLLLANNNNSNSNGGTGDVNFFRDIVSPFLLLGQDLVQIVFFFFFFFFLIVLSCIVLYCIVLWCILFLVLEDVQILCHS
jgi:hypothetical protein